MIDLPTYRNGITPHPTWQVIDGSKITAFNECPRKFFYKYILGWRPTSPSNHLIFGTAWHLAMEHLLLNGYSAEHLVDAYELFLVEYRKTFPPDTDRLMGAKTPARAFEALRDYALHYANDVNEFRTLRTEVAGSVMISDVRRMYWRMDSVCERLRDGKIFSLEHKTASSLSTWARQWDLAFSTGTYLFAMNAMYPEREVANITYNGVAFLKTRFDYMRLPLRIGKDAAEQWLWLVNDTIDRLEVELARLADCSDSDNVMRAFPLNPNACSNYSGCSFKDMCMIRTNPLRSLGLLPVGMQVQFWDPREDETKPESLFKEL